MNKLTKTHFCVTDLTHNILCKKLHVFVLHQENLSRSEYYRFPTMKQSLGGQKFKYDREMEKVVTRRLISQDTTSVNRKQKSSFHIRVNASVAVWTMWEGVEQQCH